MANYGPASIKIEYDNAGGSPVDITAYVLTLNSVDVEQILEEVRPFGASWDKFLPVPPVPTIGVTGSRWRLV